MERGSYLDRAQLAIDILSGLIVSHARMLASVQYSPRCDADGSDDYIEENTRWVKELRDIRERLENLFTGMVA